MPGKDLELHSLGQWFSKWGSQASSISITWDSAGNANSCAPPQAYWIRNSKGLLSNLHFNNLSRWFYCNKFEDPWVPNSDYTLEPPRKILKTVNSHILHSTNYERSSWGWKRVCCMGVQPVKLHRNLGSEGPTLALMFCYCHFEILNNFWARIPTFHFALVPSHYVASAGLGRRSGFKVSLVILMVVSAENCQVRKYRRKM